MGVKGTVAAAVAAFGLAVAAVVVALLLVDDLTRDDGGGMPAVREQLSRDQVANVSAYVTETIARGGD